MDRLRNLGDECVAAAKEAIRNQVQRRMFAAQADAENLVNAAQAEMVMAEALDQQHEFNRAALRGAKLALSLAETIWAARFTRLEGLEEAIGTGAQLLNFRLFWIIPRAPKGLVL
jgi:ATP-dependent helicase HepA